MKMVLDQKCTNTSRHPADDWFDVLDAVREVLRLHGRYLVSASPSMFPRMVDRPVPVPAGSQCSSVRTLP